MTLRAISGFRRINIAPVIKQASTLTQKTTTVFQKHNLILLSQTRFLKLAQNNKSEGTLQEGSSSIMKSPFQRPGIISNSFGPPAIASSLSDREFLVEAASQLSASRKAYAHFNSQMKLIDVQRKGGIRVVEKKTPKEHLDFLRDTIDTLQQGTPNKELTKFQAAVTQAEKVLNQSDAVNESTVGDVYHRFFVLMERLIKQEDAAAQEIYNRIKTRTDNIDLLTNLTARINNAPKGEIDWSKDEEMKKLINAAKALGVPFPDGYKFSEEQRVILVKNIEGKQKTMESMTQLERVDFQQRMQNSSIWHQTRSNILKYLERTASTIINNMRPH